MALTPTPALRQQVRDAVSEQIPTGGTEADTLFTDAELDSIIGAVDYVDSAIAEAWARKGGRLVSDRDGIKRMQAGTEQIEYDDPIKLADHAFKMADMYRQRVPTGGTQLVGIEQPDVLGPSQGDPYFDVSRLVAGSY